MRPAVVQVQLLDQVRAAHVQVDRAVVHRPVGARGLHRADHLAALGLDHRHRVRRRAAQRDPGRRVALAARQVAPGALAQLAQADQPPRGRLPAVAEELLVAGRQRQLVCRRAQVGQEDLLGLVVQDGRLHRPVQELVGVAAEELVQRVGARHVQREARLAPAGAAPHLAQGGHRAGKRDADRRVQLADVDAQLERVGGDHGQQLARHQPLLDLAPLHRRVAGAVGGHQLGQVGAAAILEAQLGELLDQLDAAARAQEADRSRLRLHQVGQQVGRLAERGSARARALVHQRRVPHRDPALGPRCAVARHQPHLVADQPLGQLDGVGDRGAGQHEPRLGAVGQRQPAQAAQHVGHVRAEHAAVGVGLVDHHPGQVGQQVAPVGVVGQRAHVQHVGVGQDQVGARADGAPLLLRRVAVVDRGPQVGQAQRVQRPRLVLGQRLGGVEVERARRALAAERVQHRQVEGQRLAARRARGHDRVALVGRGQRVGLVGVQALHAGAGQRLQQLGVQLAGHRLDQRVLVALGRARHQLLALAALQDGLPGRGLGGGGHRSAIVRAP